MRDSEGSGLDQGLAQYGDNAFSSFLRKGFIKGAGYSDDALNRPVIGVVNTGSGFNPCHGNMPQLLEAVRRGVMLAGGLAVDFPTISIHESFSSPTSMFLRNLMAMDTEEMIRAQPMDAVVLIGGCDKTVPAQLMGACSADRPAVQLITGSMLTGSYRGERVGACSDCRRFWALYRADQLGETALAEVNEQLVASVGTCSVMGTASTMAILAEVLGITVAGGASAPAVTADRMRIAEASGRMAVEAARTQRTPSQFLSRRSFENAARVLLAIGGSTNGLIHLCAVAGRLGIDLDLHAFDAMGRETPVLVDLKPSGRYYMEDFHAAGGVPALLAALRPLLHLDALTVSGRTLGALIQSTLDAKRLFSQTVIRSLRDPVYPEGGLAVLRGNLAPAGCVIKPSAASPHLLEHEGRALVFEGLEDLARRIDDPSLDVLPGDILVLKNIGPKGAPGMPEAGMLPIPRKLAREGVKDMVRISDGRMSGTASGTIVLHVSPESAAGGPLAWVRSGDRIRLSVRRRELLWLVDDAEIERRRASAPIEAPSASRGYRKLYLEQVLQAEKGVDFAFLRAPSAAETPR
ncbi:MAG: dihydroxy-acid dehydratase [Betaproteobacteria bacterium]|nr:dihydroxy-acid dehydratase [Betaproteobacteria bacterium]